MNHWVGVPEANQPCTAQTLPVPCPDWRGWHRGELRAWCAAHGVVLITLGSVAWVDGVWWVGFCQHRVTTIQHTSGP